MSNPILRSDDVEAAIARVLAAEADAGHAVKAAEVAAQQSLELARSRVRRVAEHTGERLQRMTLRIEAACARDVAKLSATAATTAIASKSDADLLARVIETIAAELTGASR